MGKGRIIGIVMFSLIAIFFAVMLANGMSEASKYEGLTEEQISNVKIFWERCESSAYLAGIGSQTATDRALEKCKEVEAKKISEYRTQNNS